MSDPRLTAEHVKKRYMGIVNGAGVVALAESHEALRADVERLTAENAMLQAERDHAQQRMARLDEVKSTWMPEELAALTAENAALREELAKAMPMQAQATCIPICGKRTASGFLCTLEPDHADVCIPLVDVAAGTIEVASDGRVFLHDGPRTATIEALRADVDRLTAENAALKSDIIYMAREAGNAMPVDEMLNKLRTAREESDE